eukprot:SAG22_NODE_1680_length_3824_cov_1.537181_2_plen_183_part_00
MGGCSFGVLLLSIHFACPTCCCQHQLGSWCEFEIKTDWNSDDYATGGLGLAFCLNGTASGCGCEAALPWPAVKNCYPLADHGNGRYSGALGEALAAEGLTAVGLAAKAANAPRFASFRLFRRAFSPQNHSLGPLRELVVGMVSQCQPTGPSLSLPFLALARSLSLPFLAVPAHWPVPFRCLS